MHKTWSETVAELAIKNAGRVSGQLHASRG